MMKVELPIAENHSTKVKALHLFMWLRTCTHAKLAPAAGRPNSEQIGPKESQYRLDQDCVTLHEHNYPSAWKDLKKTVPVLNHPHTP